MKIVLATGIYPPETGGPARRVPMLAMGLVGFWEENEVAVVTYGDGNTLHDDKRWTVDVVSRRGGVLVRYIRFAWHVFKRLKSADAVLAQSPVSDGLPTCLAAWLARKPFLLNVVGDYAWEIAQQNGETALLDPFLEKRHQGKIGLLETLERWVARRAKKVIVPSQYLKSVVERWGIARERIEVIYNAVKPAMADPQGVDLRASIGLMPMDVLILTNVRAVPWKGVETLLEALINLPEHVHLAHIGDGPLLARWKAKATEIGIGSRVHWLGTMASSKVDAWLAAANVFALASGYEGYPFVVAEALRSGVPCLVSDQAGNKEMGELYPGVVTVIPYQDVNAWNLALAGSFKKFDASTVELPTFEGMVAAYERQFKNVCAS